MDGRFTDGWDQKKGNTKIARIRQSKSVLIGGMSRQKCEEQQSGDEFGCGDATLGASDLVGGSAGASGHNNFSHGCIDKGSSSEDCAGDSDDDDDDDDCDYEDGSSYTYSDSDSDSSSSIPPLIAATNIRAASENCDEEMKDWDEDGSGDSDCSGSSGGSMPALCLDPSYCSHDEEEEEGGEIQLRIKQANADTAVLSLTCPSSTTVLELKNIMRDNHLSSVIPASRMRLIYNGQMLKDDEVLGVGGLNVGGDRSNVIHYVPRPPGSAPSQRANGAGGGASAGSTVGAASLQDLIGFISSTIPTGSSISSIIGGG